MNGLPKLILTFAGRMCHGSRGQTWYVPSIATGTIGALQERQQRLRSLHVALRRPETMRKRLELHNQEAAVECIPFAKLRKLPSDCGTTNAFIAIGL